jgi:hypothetical protein
MSSISVGICCLDIFSDSEIMDCVLVIIVLPSELSYSIEDIEKMVKIKYIPDAFLWRLNRWRLDRTKIVRDITCIIESYQSKFGN